MFLHLLNKDEQSLFLRLAVLMAAADNNIAEEEKQLIKHYVRECGQQEYDYESDSRNLATVLETLGNATIQVKKAILLEAIGIAFSDSILANEENALLSQNLPEFST